MKINKVRIMRHGVKDKFCQTVIAISDRLYLRCKKEWVEIPIFERDAELAKVADPEKNVPKVRETLRTAAACA